MIVKNIDSYATKKLQAFTVQQIYQNALNKYTYRKDKGHILYIEGQKSISLGQRRIQQIKY